MNVNSPSRRYMPGHFRLGTVLLIGLGWAILLGMPQYGDGEDKKPDTSKPLPAKIEPRPRLLFSRAEIEKRLADPQDPISRWKNLDLGSLMATDPAQVDTKYLNQMQMGDILAKLGLGYQLTGKKEYARKVLDLLNGLADKGFPYWSKGTSDSHDIGAGDLFVGMALGLDWASGEFTPQERAVIMAKIHDYTWKWYEQYKKFWSYTGRGNHTAVAVGGLGLIALTFLGEPGLDVNKTKTILDDARAIMIRCYTLFNTDGAYPADVMYCNYNLHSSLLFAIALKRMTGEDIVAGTGVVRTPEWFPYTRVLWRKDGIFHINDNDDVIRVYPQAMSHFAPLALFAEHADPFVWMVYDICNDPYQDLFMTLYLPKRTEKTSPDTLPLCRIFPDRQIAYFRTSFTDTKGTVAAFEVRGKKALGEHLQYDLNNFVIDGLGEPFFVDSGYGSGPTKAGSCSRSDAHNCITIDGKGQESKAKGEYENRCAGELLGFAAAPQGFAGVGGNAAEYWEIKKMDRFFIMAPRDVAPYFICVDRLRVDEKPHAYTWCWQAGGDLSFTWDNNTAKAQKGSGPALQATFVCPKGPLDFVSDELTLRENNVKHRRLRITPRKQAVDETFLVVLDLQGEGVPKIEVSPLEVTGGVGVCVQTDTWTDWILVNTCEKEVGYSSGGARTNGKVAIMRFARDATGKLAGKPQAYFCFGGSYLSKDSTRLVQTQGDFACVSVVADSVASIGTDKAIQVTIGASVQRCIWNQADGKVRVSNGQSYCTPPARQKPPSQR